jgi:hypothetical protein
MQSAKCKMVRAFCELPAVALCALMFANTGCAPAGPKVVKVNGTITRGGKPVQKLFVNFYPEHGRPSWGVTDQDGHYTLNYEQKGDGAVTGKHRVWVQLRPASPKEEADLRNETIKLHPEIQEILKKYGKLETTPLTVEVKEDTRVIDLPLD